MDLHKNEFLAYDRKTPTLGGEISHYNDKSNDRLKKNESKLKQMMSDAAMKPIFPNRPNNLHTFQK